MLKDYILKDIKDNFFNLNDFAEEHQVDNKPALVIIDKLELLKRSANQSDITNGIYKQNTLLYIQTEHFDKKPVVGKILNLDGKIFKILDVTEENAVYALTLEVHRV